MTSKIHISNYPPFGVLLQNRNFTGEKYRYGFQGQERDDEIAGNGNSYTAEFWQYDSRLGRRWNIDPVIKEHESLYACISNNPIWFVDPDGLDTIRVTYGNVVGDKNIKSVSFQKTGFSDNLVVYYPEDNQSGPGRTDFKEGSYEHYLMHQKKQMRFQGGRLQEVEAHKYLNSNGIYTDANGASYQFSFFFELTIEFKPPSQSSIDQTGVIKFESVKNSLNFIANKMTATNAKDSELKATNGNFSLYPIVFSQQVEVLAIGYHSPEVNDGLTSIDAQNKANKQLASSRSYNVTNYLQSLGIPKVKLNNANGGESDVRKAVIIIHSKAAIESYTKIAPATPPSKR